jgi:predicted Zn-dependent peptidase
MYHLALDELAYGAYIPLATHLDEVAAVTREEVMDLAGRFFTPEGWTVAAVGPSSAEKPVRAGARALGAD